MRLVLRSVVVFVFLTSGFTAQGAVDITHHVKYMTPSTLKHVDSEAEPVRIYLACYGYDWLYNRLPLNCDFSLWVSYPDNPDPDGHNHDEQTRPLVYRKRHFIPGSLGPKPVYEGPGKLEFPFDFDAADRRVSGHTINAGGLQTSAVIDYPLPEVSGDAQLDIQLTLPPGWHYAYPDGYRTNMTWDQYRLHIGVPGLVELPEPGPEDRYIKVRTFETEHPDSVAFYIQSIYLNELKTLAQEYYKRSGEQRVLSLNDMTLPKGGLFDIKADWAPPHRSHRDGTDADVNQVFIPCFEDTLLIQAARQTLPNLRDEFGTGGNTDSAILCEGGGRKHIDFEREG